MTDKTWQPLHKHAIVDIIAPSTACSKQDVEKVRDLLISWELVPRIPEDILGNDLLCANSDEIRFVQLKNALLSEDSKAIWCLKGGYGCARLVTELEKLPTPKQNKLFIGFSDITVLHLFLRQKWNWPTLHGPSARQVALELIEQDNIQELKRILFGKQQNIEFQLSPWNEAAKKNISIASTITGGTLSLLQTSIGTNWQVESKNKILFLEDVNERGYQIDRMLQHLKQAGIFDAVKAVILGDFIGGEESAGNSLVSPVLQRFAEESNFPVLHCPTVGHGKLNRILPFNTQAELILAEQKLIVTTGCIL